MSNHTSIQWTDYTWSPWLGCRKVSPGCENCYITTTTPFRVRHLEHGPRRDRTAEAYWRAPMAWNRKAEKEGVRRRVFPSLCDPFDPEVTIQWFLDFMVLVLQTPHLDWLLLTKRPRFVMPRWRQAHAHFLREKETLPDNVWLGVSVEDQKRTDERIPQLLSIDAKTRFLSVEPMLENINLHLPHRDSAGPSIDWAIFGGESGTGARPCDVDWISDGVMQCQSAGVKAFVKQLGSRPRWNSQTIAAVFFPDLPLPLKHPKGGDPEEWPQDLRVREFPQVP